MLSVSDRCRKEAITLGWRYPFFLMSLAYAEFVEDPSIQTACVGLSGKVRINPEFLKELPGPAVGGVVFHELMHLMMEHAGRRGGREAHRWNIACDMAINTALRQMGIQLPSGVVYAPYNCEGMTSEQLYDLPQCEEAAEQTRAQLGAIVGSGCGIQDDLSGDGGTQEAASAAARQWAEVAIQASALAAGTAAGKILANALKPPPCRVRWEQVLRSAFSRALAAHGRDDQTWSRRSRRQPPGVILPGWQATRAQAAVVLDASGSMSDEAIAICVASTLRIARAADVRLYLVVHDAIVQHAGWVKADRADKVFACVRGRGGTDFGPAYEAVAQAAGRFDCMIHLTDGEPCGEWPARPINARRLVVGLWGDYEEKVPAGTTIIKVQP